MSLFTPQLAANGYIWKSGCPRPKWWNIIPCKMDIIQILVYECLPGHPDTVRTHLLREDFLNGLSALYVYIEYNLLHGR